MHKARIDRTRDAARADVFGCIEAFTIGFAVTAIRAASVTRHLNRRWREKGWLTIVPHPSSIPQPTLAPCYPERHFRG